MKKALPHTATERTEVVTSELRAVTVNGHTEMLPGDPKQIARILAERRNKPAAKARARMNAAGAKRGLDVAD